MEEEFKVEINIPKQRDGDQKVGFIVTARSRDDNRLDSVRDCIDRIEDILCGRWKVLFFTLIRLVAFLGARRAGRIEH